MLLLKNPIERFRSSQMILPDRVKKTPEGNTIERPPISEYLERFLDNDEEVLSPHNWGQLEQHRGVEELEIYRLEGSTHLAGVELPWLNKTEEKKPLIADHPRYPELYIRYEEDIAAWQTAIPLTK